jgi:hypothetical protein
MLALTRRAISSISSGGGSRAPEDLRGRRRPDAFCRTARPGPTRVRHPCDAWTLMPNPVHLLLQTGKVPVAAGMRRLLTGYAVTCNRRHRPRPPLPRPVQIHPLSAGSRPPGTDPRHPLASTPRPTGPHARGTGPLPGCGAPRADGTPADPLAGDRRGARAEWKPGARRAAQVPGLRGGRPTEGAETGVDRRRPDP